MPVQEREIKMILEIQSNERFAKLFLQECTTKIIVLSEKEVYIFNKEFKYYQRVKDNGLIINLFSEVLHKVLEEWNDKFKKDFAAIVMNKELDKEEKDMLKDNMNKILKSVITAIKNIESTPFINNTIKLILVKATLSPDQQNKLNRLDNYLNFRNCKLDLKTLDYSDRTEDDFITKYILTMISNQKLISPLKNILKKSFIKYVITTKTIMSLSCHTWATASHQK